MRRSALSRRNTRIYLPICPQREAKIWRGVDDRRIVWSNASTGTALAGSKAKHGNVPYIPEPPQQPAPGAILDRTKWHPTDHLTPLTIV
jgi:hypothetical protein